MQPSVQQQQQYINNNSSSSSSNEPRYHHRSKRHLVDVATLVSGSNQVPDQLHLQQQRYSVQANNNVADAKQAENTAPSLRFVLEPPTRLEFSNSTGAVVACVATITAGAGHTAAAAATAATATPSTASGQQQQSSAAASPVALQDGSPQHTTQLAHVRWQRADTGEEVGVALGAFGQPLRHVRQSDTALVFAPFKAHELRADVHLGAYRCVANHGPLTLVSREMRVRAVVEQQHFQVEVFDEFVIEGNTAVFKCQVPAHVRDHVHVDSWLEHPTQATFTASASMAQLESLWSANVRQQRAQQVQPAGASVAPNLLSSSSAVAVAVQLMRYFVVPRTGELYIYNVDASINYRAYKCRVRHTLTGALVESSAGGKLIVTESHAPVAPRITDARYAMHALENELVVLTCSAQAFPKPSYLWYRKSAGPTSGGDGTGNRPMAMVIGDTTLAAIDNMQQQQQQSTTAPTTTTTTTTTTISSNDHERFVQLGGTLVVNGAKHRDTGLYVCSVNNSVGEERIETELQVRAPLEAQLLLWPRSPEAGKSLTINCSHRGAPVHSIVFAHNGRFFKWSTSATATFTGHNGRHNTARSELNDNSNNNNNNNNQQDVVNDHGWPTGTNVLLTPDVLSTSTTAPRLLNEHTIVIDKFERRHAGIYQCFVSNYAEQVQASLELRLDDEPPRMRDTFLPKHVDAGADVSLACAATATPLPQITWSVDEMPVPESSGRVRFGDFVTKDNLVVSYVNISGAHVDDGGMYACQADNGIASVRHEALVAVTGAPGVKAMPNVTIVAATLFRIRCPAVGYPLQEIVWFQNGKRLPTNHRQRVHDNGTLEVEHVEKSFDDGQYTCSVSAPDGQQAHGSTYVTIKVKPVIEAFAFPKALREGQRASVMCTLSSGDLPLAISWLKDGKPIVQPPPSVTGHQDHEDTPTSHAHSNGNAAPDVTMPVPPHVRIEHVSAYSSSLLFESVSMQQSGNYTCLAHNDAGNASHSAPMIIHVYEQQTNIRIEQSSLANERNETRRNETNRIESSKSLLVQVHSSVGGGSTNGQLDE
ncbi:Down syndrome cell adhesion molecule-like protein Dscam2, partial [Fragariocoptes setiger]